MGTSGGEPLVKIKRCGWVFQLLQYSRFSQLFSSIFAAKFVARRCTRWTYPSASSRLGSSQVPRLDQRTGLYQICSN